MIVTDGVHMISDSSEEELHEFAEKIGLKRHWFRAKSFPHYDLPKKMKYEDVLAAGAYQITPRELVKIIMKRRES